MVHHNKFIAGMATLPQTNISFVIWNIWGAAFYFTLNIAFTIVIHLSSIQVPIYGDIYSTLLLFGHLKDTASSYLSYIKLMHILGNYIIGYLI